jgi:hypothetical protein
MKFRKSIKIVILNALTSLDIHFLKKKDLESFINLRMNTLNSKIRKKLKKP